MCLLAATAEGVRWTGRWMEVGRLEVGKRETVVDVDRVQSGPPTPGEVDSGLSPPAETCASKATKKRERHLDLADE
jgi:hypothetical protein